MTALHRITVLVDWDTARRLARSKTHDVRSIESTIEQLQVAISRYVISKDRKDFYRVHWRIYHGWHRGKSKTSDRLLFDKYVGQSGSRTINNVSFGAEFEFSGVLSCQTDRGPIFDTVRIDGESRKLKQKMVDTMLVCDLLHLARTKESTMLIVVANDDDFVPALYTAESWKAKVVMLHTRDSTNSLLKLDGIAERIA